MENAQEVLDAINEQYNKSYTLEYLIERGNAEIRRSLDSAIAQNAKKEAFNAIMAKVKATGKTVEEIIADL